MYFEFIRFLLKYFLEVVILLLFLSSITLNLKINHWSLRLSKCGHWGSRNFDAWGSRRRRKYMVIESSVAEALEAKRGFILYFFVLIFWKSELCNSYRCYTMTLFFTTLFFVDWNKFFRFFHIFWKFSVFICNFSIFNFINVLKRKTIFY